MERGNPGSDFKSYLTSCIASANLSQIFHRFYAIRVNKHKYIIQSSDYQTLNVNLFWIYFQCLGFPFFVVLFDWSAPQTTANEFYWFIFSSENGKVRLTSCDNISPKYFKEDASFKVLRTHFFSSINIILSYIHLHQEGLFTWQSWRIS